MFAHAHWLTVTLSPTDHMYRMGMMSMLLAGTPGVDYNRWGLHCGTGHVACPPEAASNKGLIHASPSPWGYNSRAKNTEH